MKLRLGSSVRNVHASVALGLLVGTVVGCSDDRTSVDPGTTPDSGLSSESSATIEPTGVTPTSGDEPSDTTGPGTTTTNPTTTTPVVSTDLPTDVSTSETPVETTSEVPTSGPGTDVLTTGPVTSDVPTGGSDTSPPNTEDTGGPVTPIGVGASAPPNDIILVSDFEVGDDQGFADGSGLTPTFAYANSVASLEIPFTQGNYQSGGIDFNVAGNYCGNELVARVKLVSGFDGAGGVQLRAWSSDWGQFVGGWANINSASQTGQWIEYSFDLDEAVSQPSNFDPTDVAHVGVAILTGGSADTPFTTATFEVDWIGFREKPGGCPGDDTSDTGSTNTGGGTDTGAVSDPDAGVVDTGETAVPDDDAGVVDTSAPAETGDASVDEPTLDLGDASVSEPPATSSAPETSSSAPVASSSEPEPYGPNLHTNSGFEASGDYWYLTGGGSVARSTTYAHTGTYSLYNTGRTATWNGAGTNLVSNGFVTAPLVQGKTYLIQAWVRLDGLASATVALSGSFMCDGAASQPWLANATANDTGWTLVSGEFTTPSCGGAGLTDASLIVNNPGTAASIYLDDFSVQEVLN